MIRIGLTGKIGAGKSTAVGLLRNWGFPVHEADATVHILYTQMPILVEIGKLFPGIVRHAKLNRQHLAAALAKDPSLKSKLEAIIHPAVQADRAAWTASLHARGTRAVIYDIPLLFETGRDIDCDATINLTAPTETRWHRVQSRVHMTREKFDMLNAAQWDDDRRSAHYQLDNSSSFEAFSKQLREITSKILSNID